MKTSLAFATLLIAPGAATSIKPMVQGKLAADAAGSGLRPHALAADAVAGLPLEVGECTTSGGCTTSTKYVVLDQNWLWYTTSPDGTGTDCNPTASGGYASDSCQLVQPDSYPGTYGITTDGTSLHLPYYFENEYSVTEGSRLYLLDSDSSYTSFSMLGKEISFDVELSTLPCGFNAAVYFVDMSSDGGASTGTQGPAYGTGYCDAQCPSDLHTTPTGTPNTDATSVCCQEMDLFEANTEAMAMTPHPCEQGGSAMSGPYVCSGDECSSGDATGVCDGSGCDFNPYRDGDTTFYGPGSGYSVDSTQTMTVTTQFITDTSGGLSEIAQIYTVNGAVVQRSSVTLDGSSFDSMTSAYCDAEATAFNQTSFGDKGGLSTMASALESGMVLTLSLWNDPSSHMLWLDGESGSGAGSVRGPCGTTDDSEDTDGNPTDAAKAAAVTYSNIKWGDIGSTYDASSTGAPSTPTTSTASPTAAPTPSSSCSGSGVAWQAQCAYGSITGELCCADGYVCCDNGGAPGQYASCQTESYCTGADAANCESDNARTTPCTIVDGL